MKPAVASLPWSDADRAPLEGWLYAGKTEPRLANRARLILTLDDGGPRVEAAIRGGVDERIVANWKGTFCGIGRRRPGR